MPDPIREVGATAATQPVDLLDGGLMTVRAAASFLSVARSTVYTLMEQGLPFCKLGRARRIPRRALLEYAAAHLHGGQEERPR